MPSGKSRFDSDGASAQRPRHPDFWMLSDIVLWLDSLSQESDTTAIERHVEVDLQSLFYVASQRVFHVVKEIGAGPKAMAAAWFDGFAAGKAYAERKNGPEIDRLVSALHSHREHPDFEYATTTNGRKDGMNAPPVGEGWEVNEDYNGGFERFDYHEENYWRRHRDDGGNATPKEDQC